MSKKNTSKGLVRIILGTIGIVVFAIITAANILAYIITNYHAGSIGSYFINDFFSLHLPFLYDVTNSSLPLWVPIASVIALVICIVVVISGNIARRKG